MKIPLTKHQADALLSDLAEIAHISELINQLATMRAKLIASNNRHSAAPILDAGENPAKYSDFNVTAMDAKGESFMTLTPIPTPTDPGTKE